MKAVQRKGMMKIYGTKNNLIPSNTFKAKDTITQLLSKGLRVTKTEIKFGYDYGDFEKHQITCIIMDATIIKIPRFLNRLYK